MLDILKLAFCEAERQVQHPGQVGHHPEFKGFLVPAGIYRYLEILVIDFLKK